MERRTVRQAGTEVAALRWGWRTIWTTPQGVVLAVAAAVAAITTYNNIKAFAPHLVDGTLYVPLNLLFLAVASGTIVPCASLTWEQLGVSWRHAPRSALLGLAIGVLIPAPLFLFAFFPGLVDSGTNDPRIAGIGLPELLFRALVRIPLGTALFEEMLFRGLLYGLMLKAWGHRSAILGTSAAFGLWHIEPTRALLRQTGFFDSDSLLAAGVIGGVLATFLAGLVFAYMRYRTRHVIGGILAHALINSLAAVAMFLR